MSEQMSFGFGGAAAGTIIREDSTQGLATKIADDLNETVFEKIEGLKAFGFEKTEHYTQDITPSYDSIIVCFEKGDFVSYYHMVLGVTGDPEPLGTQLVHEYERSRTSVFVPADTMDQYYLDLVLEFLEKEYPGRQHINAEGVFLPNGLEADAPIKYHANLAKNQCATIVYAANGVKDLNITEEKQKKGWSFALDVRHAEQDFVDKLMMVKPTSWQVALTAHTEASGKVDSRNVGGRSKDVLTVSGFTDFMPVQNSNPATGITKMTIMPIFVMNTIDTSPAYTLGNVLLSIAVASQIMKIDYRALFANNIRRQDIGVLMSFIDGAPKKLSDPNLPIEKVYEGVCSMVDDPTLPQGQKPVLALDISSFGMGSTAMKYLAQVGREADADGHIGRHVIQTCVRLTNGKFPADFDPNSIFTGTTAILPEGTYVKKGKEKPTLGLGPVEILMTAKNANDIAYSQAQAFAGVPKKTNENGRVIVEEPFLTNIKNTIAVAGDPRITNRVLRRTFNPAFIATLAKAVSDAGLNTEVNAPMMGVENYTFASAVNPYESAQVDVTHLAGFKSAPEVVGNGYTPYVMGM